MNAAAFSIHPDVRRASLPPAALYGDPGWFEAIRRVVLARSWHLMPELSGVPSTHNVVPVDLCGEPCLWTRDGDGVDRLLSNVCTHRGATVVDGPCRARTLRCSYHGRRWKLDGTLAAAPGFDGAADFPAVRDNLRSVSIGRAGPWVFGSIDPARPLEEWLGPVFERLDWFPWHALEHDPDCDRDYDLDVAFALYLDNYLEGFHVPFVHPGLASALDSADYRNELLPQGTLQIGITRDPADAFEIPASSPDSGEGIGGYYFWLFPTTMVNVYPWGVSLNLVVPTGPQQTTVRYRTWVCDPTRRETGAGSALDQVELEDQAVVARTQAGVRSILYPGGRYAPEHEVGVHHFHRLLAAALG